MESPTELLELEAFQAPHIVRARICIAIIAGLFALTAAINMSRVAENQPKVDAFGQEISRAATSEGRVLGLDLARQEFRKAERALSEARFLAGLQSVLFIAFLIAALLIARFPWEGSLSAAIAFGCYVLVILVKEPGVLLLPDTLTATILVAVVLYLALAAGSKIRKATGPSL